MNKLIVVTNKENWETFFNDFCKNYPGGQHTDNLFQITEDGYQLYVISNNNNPSSTATLVKELLNDSDKIIICSHKGYMDEDEINHHIVHFSHSEHSEKDLPVGKLLIDLSKKKGKVGEVFESLRKKKVDNSIMQCLSLFLPLDIDLQTLWSGEHLDKKAHWQEILNSKQSLTYEVRFEELVKAAENGITCIPQFYDGKSIRTFFNKLDSNVELDEMEKDGYKLTKEKDDPHAAPFHKWFCDVASCLRGRKTCTG